MATYSYKGKTYAQKADATAAARADKGTTPTKNGGASSALTALSIANAPKNNTPAPKKNTPTAKSGGGVATGLTANQVNNLKGLPGINQSLLNSYKSTNASGGFETPTNPFQLALTQAEKDQQAAQDNLLKINQAEADQRISQKGEYQNALKAYQGQINSTNAVYNDLLNKARIEGQGRLGTDRAQQARGGLLGSDFGTAQQNRVTDDNMAQEGTVQNERQTSLEGIYSLARTDAKENYNAKIAAKKAGAEAVLKYHTETVPALAKARLSKIASALLTNNIDPKTMSASERKLLADTWNVSEDDITQAYGALKSENEQVAQEADLETRKSEADIAKINADIASGKLITLSEGNKLYNTETGEVIAYNPKTYAPKSGGGGEITPIGGVTPLVGQANYSKLTAAQKKQADSLNNLVRSLNEYKTYYEANPGAGGGVAGNLFGADSGQLETKLNSIIFAAAQAEGTGALQAADRQVIEKIIPNPTSFGGALNTLTKGGASANVARIQDQIAKYTANLGQLGLSPALAGDSVGVAPASPSGTTLTSPDGSQEVNVADLTPAELQEAKDAGWL